MAVRDIYSIIKSPVLTEKATKLLENRIYTFYVDINANKIEIKNAIEKLYNVKVERVNSIIEKGKTKRLRFNQSGKTKTFKKAIVKLKKGYEIKLG